MDLLLHPSDQPVFRLAVQTCGCQLEVRLNDVPVFRDPGTAPLNFEMPVNEWLFAGPNQVGALVTPLPGAKAQASIGIIYKRLRQPLKHAVVLGTIKWEPDGEQPETGDRSPGEWPATEDFPYRSEPGIAQPVSVECLPVIKGEAEASAHLRAMLTLPLPWPARPWQGGANLGGQGGLQTSIHALTQKFWQAIATRNERTMLQMAAARVKDIETAYHLREGEAAEVLLFPKLLASPDWQVLDLPRQGVVLELAGEERLARLIREDDGQSTLRLLNERTGVEAVVDAWWTFTNNWTLVR